MLNRRPEAVSVRKAALLSATWIAISVSFGVGVWLMTGPALGLQFFTGYLIEKGLSVDNLFVFVVILRAFAVPQDMQHRVLFWGIFGAIIMRGLFIGLGAALVGRFEWVLYLFGIFLVITAIKLVVQEDAPVDPRDRFVVRIARRFLPMTDGYRGASFVLREGGRMVITPLLLVLLVIETTDVIFATDSIPAVFGITRDPFIIFSSNIAAILGLRALFFLLAHVVERFSALSYGLAAILAFIGLKLLLEDVVQISVVWSLGIVLGVLVVSALASIVINRRREGAVDAPGESETEAEAERAASE